MLIFKKYFFKNVPFAVNLFFLSKMENGDKFSISERMPFNVEAEGIRGLTTSLAQLKKNYPLPPICSFSANRRLNRLRISIWPTASKGASIIHFTPIRSYIIPTSVMELVRRHQSFRDITRFFFKNVDI